MPRKPPHWTWINPVQHNREDEFGNGCHHIKHCPYVLADGSKCNKPGCLGLWKSKKHSDLKNKPMVMYIVRHAHYIVDSYAQSRNTSHIIEGSQRPARENEILTTWRVRKDIKFPKYILEDFDRF